MAITFVVKIFGFVEKLVLAYFFGTGYELDSYIVAFSVPFAIFIIIREIIEPSFLPTFMKIRNTSGEAESWRLYNITSSILIILLLAVIVAGLTAAPQLVQVIAPGFKGIQKEKTILLVRIMIPACIFLGLSTVSYITLNAYKRFALPASGDVFFKVVPMLALGLFHRVAGVTALALGVVAGAFSRLAIHGFGLRRKMRMLSFDLGVRYPPVRDMSKLMAPLVLGVAFSQLSLIIDNIFASMLETGSIAALSFARRLVEMPVVVLPYALGIVIFPFFTELAIAKNMERSSRMLVQTIKITMLVFVPLAIGMAVLRTPIVRLLFERGAFDAYSTHLTSSAVMYYAIGLVAFAVETVLVQFYFSTSDTRTPIFVGILCVLLNILLTFMLIKVMKHNGIAAALSISKTVKVAVLYLILKRRLGGDIFNEPVGLLAKTAVSGIFAGVSAYFSLVGLESFVEKSVAGDIAIILSSFSIGTIIFVASGLMMRVKEYRTYYGFVKSRIRDLF